MSYQQSDSKGCSKNSQSEHIPWSLGACFQACQTLHVLLQRGQHIAWQLSLSYGYASCLAGLRCEQSAFNLNCQTSEVTDLLASSMQAVR
jgi:hypothetical protein